MILYLSSNQHTNLLDFTGLFDDDTVTIKKMVGSFVLKQFIIYNMRNFSHCNELILDRPAFGDSDTEFAEAIEEFLTMYSARITVIYEGLEQTETGFAFDGVEYLNQDSISSCNFIIHDIGRDYTENTQLVGSADILLLCCGVKPYEMQYTMRLLRQFETEHAFVVCPFVDDSLKESYAPVLQSDYHKVVFMEYQPDMMNTGPNSKNYKGIVQKYIAEA